MILSTLVLYCFGYAVMAVDVWWHILTLSRVEIEREIAECHISHATAWNVFTNSLFLLVIVVLIQAVMDSCIANIYNSVFRGDAPNHKRYLDSVHVTKFIAYAINIVALFPSLEYCVGVPQVPHVGAIVLPPVSLVIAYVMVGELRGELTVRRLALLFPAVHVVLYVAIKTFWVY